MNSINLVEFQQRIGRMCSTLVARVNDHTRRLDRWPEELSQLNQVVAVVNELGRVVNRMKESAAAGEEDAQRSKTQMVLAMTFQNVLDSVDSTLHEGEDDSCAEAGPFVFDGRIFGLGEVLHFLADNERSGQVTIESADERFMLTLRQGRLVCASSSNSPAGCRLGEILVRRFGVDKELLSRFMNRRRDDGQPLGRALSDHEIVPAAVVHEALTYQITGMFERCMQLKDADVIYDPCAENDDFDGPCLKLADLLFETACPREQTES